MLYAYTIIYVDDVAATVEFYQAAFGFAKKFMTPECDYAELVSGPTTIAFGTIQLGNSNINDGLVPLSKGASPSGVELAFTTEQIRVDFAKAIGAGATEQQAISTKPWGQEVGYLRDINGVLIELCSPMNS